jgi:hypothetical protein
MSVVQPGAHCVISVVNGDEPACTVHTHYAPCPRSGEPASTVPMHADSDNPRDQVLAYWREITDEQRTLVIHDGGFGDCRPHEVGDDTSCWCSPEVVVARQHRTEPAVRDVDYSGGTS